MRARDGTLRIVRRLRVADVWMRTDPYETSMSCSCVAHKRRPLRSSTKSLYTFRGGKVSVSVSVSVSVGASASASARASVSVSASASASASVSVSVSASVSVCVRVCECECDCERGSKGR